MFPFHQTDIFSVISLHQWFCFQYHSDNWSSWWSGKRYIATQGTSRCFVSTCIFDRIKLEIYMEKKYFIATKVDLYFIGYRNFLVHYSLKRKWRTFLGKSASSLKCLRLWRKHFIDWNVEIRVADIWIVYGVEWWWQGGNIRFLTIYTKSSKIQEL